MTLKRCLFALVLTIFLSGSLFAHSSVTTSLFGLARPGAFKVVMILDCEGNLDFEVIDDEIIRLVKTDLSSRCRLAKKEWSTAKKEWQKKFPDVRFNAPKPITPKVTVVKKGFHSKDEARSDLTELRAGGPYCIYQVLRGEEKRVEIDQCSKIPGIKYTLENEYHQAMQNWLVAKAEFEKENSDLAFDQAAPAKVSLKILKNKIKTMDKANDLVVKYDK